MDSPVRNTVRIFSRNLWCLCLPFIRDLKSKTMLTIYWVCLQNAYVWILKIIGLIVRSIPKNGLIFEMWVVNDLLCRALFPRAATPKRSLLVIMKNINEYNIKNLQIKWIRSGKRLMSPQLLPRRQWITGQNKLFFFSFLFGKESERSVRTGKRT